MAYVPVETNESATMSENTDSNKNLQSAVCAIGENVNSAVDMYRSSVAEKFKNVFKKKNTPIIGFEVNIELKPGAIPRFLKAAVPPYALRPKIEEKFKEMVENGIVKPVDYSDWGTQLVVVPKNSGDIRICGNYKITLNPQILNNCHPIPFVDK